MKTRTIETVEQLEKFSKDVMVFRDYLPIYTTISQGKEKRGEGANSRYWAMLQESLEIISSEVNDLAETLGYTPIEARRVIAHLLPWEDSLILACRKSEPAHEVMKMVFDIPTSTRLGTKEFAGFGDKIDEKMAKIVGAIRAICRKEIR